MTAPKISGVPARLPMPAEMIGQVDVAKWRVMTDAIWPGAKSPYSIALAWDYCKARGLDPLKRPVHIVPMWSTALNREVETIWPGINEVKTTAARSGAWAGMDPPQWGEDITETFDGGTDKHDRQLPDVEITYPESCTITVYRIVGGQRCAFTETVYWIEAYAPKNRWTKVPNEMWAKRVRGQLHKCTLAAVLRSAFPEESDYTAEEMEGKTIEGVATDVRYATEDAPQSAPETPPEPEPQQDEGDMLKVVKIMVDGQPFVVTSVLNEALRAYSAHKQKADDKPGFALANIEALRIMRDELERLDSTPKNNSLLDKVMFDLMAAEGLLEEPATDDAP